VFSGAVVLDGVDADEFLADGQLDGSRRRRRPGPGGGGTCCRPGSWSRRSTRCRPSRPCGSPTRLTATGAGPRCGSAGGLGPPDRGGFLGRFVPAGVAGEDPAVGDEHHPAVAGDFDGLTGEPLPRQVVVDAKLIRPLFATRRRATSGRAMVSGAAPSRSIDAGAGLARRNRSTGGTIPTPPPDRELDQEAQPVSQPRVTRLPEPPSPTYRSQCRPGNGTAPEHVARLPEPQRQASTGTAHRVSRPAR
jgi:hypothetical protein